MVYYTTLSPHSDISEEYKYWSKITLQLNGPIRIGIFRINKTDQEKKKEFKVTGLDENKPQLRYYPNVATGKVKSDTSFQILFDKSSSSIDNILEEIE